jgi:hypothetical protein
MITFTSLGSYGRLGNQLFQYAFLVGVSQKFKLPIHLPGLSKQVANNQPCLLNNFCLEYKQLDPSTILHTRREAELKSNGVFDTYNPTNTENVLPGTDFFGLYQSYRYWIDYKNIVKEQFKVKDQNIYSYCNEYITNLRNKYNKANIIAIHLRRGDVTGWYNYDEYKKYLKDVLAQISNAKDNFYCIFSGGSTSSQGEKDDIEWVKNFYNELPHYEVVQTYNPIIDFILMQQCDKIILGYISTFAWWSAFLSEKEVYAPKLFNYNEDIRLNYYPEMFKLF